jgi:hypothetical protein
MRQNRFEERFRTPSKCESSAFFWRIEIAASFSAYCRNLLRSKNLRRRAESRDSADRDDFQSAIHFSQSKIYLFRHSSSATTAERRERRRAKEHFHLAIHSLFSSISKRKMRLSHRLGVRNRMRATTIYIVVLDRFFLRRDNFKNGIETIVWIKFFEKIQELYLK